MLGFEPLTRVMDGKRLLSVPRNALKRITYYEPEASSARGKILNRMRESIPYSMRAYGPDGVYPDGVMYWEY